MTDMAQITAYYESGNWYVKLTGLDTAWETGHMRAVKYVVTDSDYSSSTTYPAVSIYGNPTEGGACRLKNITANQKYYVTAYIYLYIGEPSLQETVEVSSSFTAKVDSDVPVTVIKSLAAEQVDYASRDIRVEWTTVSGISMPYGGSITTIYNGSVEKNFHFSNFSTTDGMTFINVENYGTYEIILSINNDSKSIFINVSDTLEAPTVYTPSGFTDNSSGISCNISFEAVSGADKYRIVFMNNEKMVIKVFETSSSPYSVTELAYTTTYYFTVTAVSERGTLGLSSKITTLVSRPPRPAITSFSVNKYNVNLSWSLEPEAEYLPNPPFSALQYQLYDANNSPYGAAKYINYGDITDKTNGVYSITLDLSAIPDGNYRIRIRTAYNWAGSSYRYNLGSDSGFIYSDLFSLPSGNKPMPFSWTYEKKKGSIFNLTAAEWNGLTERIKAVYAYSGKTAPKLAAAVIGSDFTADMYNEAREAIQAYSAGAGSYIPTVLQGGFITADTESDLPKNNNINIIVSELNSIIEYL